MNAVFNDNFRAASNRVLDNSEGVTMIALLSALTKRGIKARATFGDSRVSVTIDSGSLPTATKLAENFRAAARDAGREIAIDVKPAETRDTRRLRIQLAEMM